MKIILLGADASANNIGQTTIPLITTPESQAYFDNIPTTFEGLNTLQKQGLVSFFTGLVSKGIFQKITHAYLPLFGFEDGWVNLKNPTEKLPYPSNGYGNYNSDGLIPLQGWLSPLTLNKVNFHWGFFNAAGGGNDRTYVSLGGNSNSSQWLGRRVATGNSGYLYDSANKSTSTGFFAAAGLIIGVNDTNNSKHMSIVNGSINVRSVVLANASPLTVVVGSTQEENTAASASTTAHSYFTFGTALSETEMADYNGLINNLMNQF